MIENTPAFRRSTEYLPCPKKHMKYDLFRLFGSVVGEFPESTGSIIIRAVTNTSDGLVLENTRSGAAVTNDVIMHFSGEFMPLRPLFRRFLMHSITVN